jgi:hypothetical protein
LDKRKRAKRTEDKQRAKRTEDKQRAKRTEDKQRAKRTEDKQRAKRTEDKQRAKRTEDKQRAKRTEDKQTKLAYVGSIAEIESIEKIAPNVPKEDQKLLQQLKVRNAEIEQWFQENPDRIFELQKDPEKVIEDLFKILKLERPREVKKLDLGPWGVTIWPLPPKVGSELLSRVWVHISTSPQNTQDFRNDPFNVIRQVASSTNASKEETDAVIAAFEWVLGMSRIEPDSLSALNAFKEFSGALQNALKLGRQ